MKTTQDARALGQVVSQGIQAIRDSYEAQILELKTQVRLRDDRIVQLEKQSATLAAEVDRLNGI